MADSVAIPGAANHTKVLRGMAEGEVRAAQSIPLGGAVHRSIVDPRIKPGSRAYAALMRDAVPAVAPQGRRAPEPEPEPEPEPFPEVEPNQPVVEDTGWLEKGEASPPWDGWTHAQIDQYAEDEGLVLPDGWRYLNLADKREWLTDHYG